MEYTWNTGKIQRSLQNTPNLSYVSRIGFFIPITPILCSIVCHQFLLHNVKLQDPRASSVPHPSGFVGHSQAYLTASFDHKLLKKSSMFLSKSRGNLDEGLQPVQSVYFCPHNNPVGDTLLSQSQSIMTTSLDFQNPRPTSKHFSLSPLPLSFRH